MMAMLAILPTTGRWLSSMLLATCSPTLSGSLALRELAKRGPSRGIPHHGSLQNGYRPLLERLCASSGSRFGNGDVPIAPKDEECETHAEPSISDCVSEETGNGSSGGEGAARSHGGGKRRRSCLPRTWFRTGYKEKGIPVVPVAETDAVVAAAGRFDKGREANRLSVISGFSKDENPWMVPWTMFTVIQVMFLWFCTFWLVGSWIIPVIAHYFGCSKETLTYRGQALYSLITDIAEGTVGIGILHRCLARFHPLPRDWFPINWRGQWYVDVLLGCLMFPVVNRLSQINLNLLPFPSPLISSYEQSIMARDPVASVLYAVVVSICCPIWEEVIFRGFLLPSLTRYLPVWASILVSAVVFGLAHFNMQRILPLTFLGFLMGILFVRSRNLLSSMLLHSLWNAFVFIGLFS